MTTKNSPEKEIIKRPAMWRIICAVAACKAARLLLRIGGRGGTALPGKVAMKFAANILAVTSAGMEIIAVTGTNGKTTTARMLEQAFSRAGKACLSNKTGANLLSGITAEFTANADFFGKPSVRYAVIECDEGALKQVMPLLRPKVLIVTNLFRDQLDRYGEVMHTLDAVRLGVKASPETILCLNADCSLTASLAMDVPNPVLYYGVNEPQGDQGEVRLSDATHCIRCGAPYEYTYHTYAHLGGFVCPSCGYRRMQPHTAAEKILHTDVTGTDITLKTIPPVSGEEMRRDIHVALPALYNVYNALAAVTAYTAAGHPAEEILAALRDISSSFGRMETFDLQGTPVQMILVKNPAGCNQAIEYVTGTERDYCAVILLNDRTADGHDISWIWDAEYEKLCADPHARQILVSGERAEDMRVRLKYGGAAKERVTLEIDLAKLITRMKESGLPVMVLPNYTSMLALRSALVKVTDKKEFWNM